MAVAVAVAAAAVGFEYLDGGPSNHFLLLNLPRPLPLPISDGAMMLGIAVR